MFIATAEALDEEMAARIEAHRKERARTWQLVEAPLDLAAAIEADAASDTAVLVVGQAGAGAPTLRSVSLRPRRG